MPGYKCVIWLGTIVLQLLLLVVLLLVLLLALLLLLRPLLGSIVCKRLKQQVRI